MRISCVVAAVCEMRLARNISYTLCRNHFFFQWNLDACRCRILFLYRNASGPFKKKKIMTSGCDVQYIVNLAMGAHLSQSINPPIQGF